MPSTDFSTILTKQNLASIFPRERADEFFEALFGDADEGAYDIELSYRGTQGNTLVIDMRLHQRPNRCLACNLTQGLPQVFARHPVIDVKGIVRAVEALLGESVQCADWSLGYTEQHSRSLHVIPLHITLKSC